MLALTGLVAKMWKAAEYYKISIPTFLSFVV